MNKWNKNFWIDYGERVLYTLLYAVLTLVTSVAAFDDVNWPVLWTTVGLPVVLMAIKGLLANLADPETGASGLPHPPAPELEDDNRFDGHAH